MDLQQHVTEATHISGGILDHVITHTNFSVDYLHVDPPEIIFDHSVITGSLLVDHSSPPPTTRVVRSWKTVDGTVLRLAITGSLLSQPPPPNASPYDLFAPHYQTLRELADFLAPEHAVCIPAATSVSVV